MVLDFYFFFLESVFRGLSATGCKRNLKPGMAVPKKIDSPGQAFALPTSLEFSIPILFFRMKLYLFQDGLSASYLSCFCLAV